jgi:hypothetical protein
MIEENNDTESGSMENTYRLQMAQARKRLEIINILSYVFLALSLLALIFLPITWLLLIPAGISAVIWGINAINTALYYRTQTTNLLYKGLSKNSNKWQSLARPSLIFEIIASFSITISILLLATSWIVFPSAELSLLATIGIYGITIGSWFLFVGAFMKFLSDPTWQNGIKASVLFFVAATFTTINIFLQINSAVIFTSAGLAAGTLPLGLMILAAIIVGLAAVAVGLVLHTVLQRAKKIPELRQDQDLFPKTYSAQQPLQPVPKTRHISISPFVQQTTPTTPQSSSSPTLKSESSK